ncbi:MAG TPA: sigma-54 dependent transcriptional regulator [Polyangiales bacterium]|nr:sigma-54 dependent transcriptional regulator [Polyangiales bacterium]
MSQTASAARRRDSRDRILCIDDDADQCSLLEAALIRLGCAVVSTTSPTTAIELIANEHFDAIITDLGMGEMDGLELCERVIATRPEIPVIVLTGQGSMDAAIGALRAGAYDFLTKPVDAKILGIGVARAVQHSKLSAEIRRLRSALTGSPRSQRIVGHSPPMQRLNELITRVGASEVSVLIQGETGTGKELVARAVHDASPRRTGPFVALNCAAVPPALLESELFGHARGAFTDATHARRGLFFEASGGTLFLDEIGEMPLETQVKLLRALQERKVRPVGSNAEIAFDARIVTATHRDLEADVRTQRFREDLYYRINVVRLEVPALRDRGTDVLELAAHFLRAAAERDDRPTLQLSPRVAEHLMRYEWPGNVRELENCIERAVALARFDQVTVESLPEAVRAYRTDRLVIGTNDVEEILPIDELGRRYTLEVIRQLNGNKTRAAQLLGLDRRTLYRKLEQYGVLDDVGSAQ